MDKYIYDENNGLWYELQERLLSAVSYRTARRKADRRFRTAALAVSVGVPQGDIHQFMKSY